MVVYISVVLLAVLSARLSQKRTLTATGEGNYEKSYEYNSPFFVISFLLLFLFLALSKNGPDIPIYAAEYSRYSFSDILDLHYEAGYELLCMMLRIVIRNPYIAIAVIKFISLYTVYRAIFLLKDRIRIDLAVTGYVILLYPLSFFLLRIMLAVGLVYLAFAYEITGRRKRCVFLLILAFFFHYTSIVVLCAYLIYTVIGHKLTSKKIGFMILGVTALTVISDKIISLLISLVPFLNKYDAYSVAADNNGVAQLILFLPMLYLFLRFNKEENSDKFYKLSAMAAVLAFGFGSLGYKYEVIGRMVYYFYFAAIIYGASVVNKRDRVRLVFGRAGMDLSVLMITVYFVLQTAMSVLTDTLGFLENYQFIWD